MGVIIGKLGKLAPKHDAKTLQMAYYLRAAPPPPPKRAWSAAASPDWGMMLNDSLGCCTCASVGHAYQVWTANVAPSHREITVPDAEILKAYEAVGGYKPGQPDTDNGAVIIDVLNYWRRHGIAGIKIEGYTSLEPGNRMHVEAGINLFGVCKIGVQLPENAQSQVGKVWSIVSGPGSSPGSWGGHDVILVDYDAIGPTCVTWGALQKMTWGWFFKYCDEAYAPFCPKIWTPAGGLSPSGFDEAQLRADLRSIHLLGEDGFAQ